MINYTFYVGKSMLAVRRSLVNRGSMPGAGAANGRQRPAVSVFTEASYSKICSGLPLGSLSGINWRSCPISNRPAPSTFRQIGKATWPRLPCPSVVVCGCYSLLQKGCGGAMRPTPEDVVIRPEIQMSIPGGRLALFSAPGSANVVG